MLAAAVMLLTVCGPAAAQGPEPRPYGADDGGGFRDVLPSGTRGRYSAPELLAFLAGGKTVPHCCDQLAMYGDLVYDTPGLTAAGLARHFKDATFGVRAGDVERRYSPRADVTILRDRGFGVPHIYGATRSGAMFGIGYATAEDRLFFMDALRHAGRGELAGFAGGANAGRDASQWSAAPYAEADLQRQYDQLDDELGPDGAIIQRDIADYVAGVNRYIAEARLDPGRMPGEYLAIGRPLGPSNWLATDVVAAASLFGAIFGAGGGHELELAAIRRALRKRFGARQGTRVFRDFRAAEDPEAPVTVAGGARFPYQVPVQRPRRGSRAVPDPGSLVPLASGARARTAAADATAGRPLLALPRAMSNALLVSARESASGHPLIVAGPQTGYFNPQILVEQDVHAPASAAGPAIDARGAAFAGANMYVQLGRGRDYAWSATSAGQDIVDTFAVPLCDDSHYRFRGVCEPIEVLDKTVAWKPNPGDPTPAGTETLHAERTKLGLVTARGTVRGRPVLFTKLRSTYFHEAGSLAGFAALNEPAAVSGPDSFRGAVARIGSTFNWFYADAAQIAFFNSGANPVRATRVDHDLPVAARFAWRGWDPDHWRSAVTPAAAHPQVTDQRFLVNWNNKAARGYAASEQDAYSSVYRSQLLSDRLRAALAGDRKLTLPGLVDVMEQAGSGDLRAHALLPLALAIIGRPRDARLRAAVESLGAWRRDGGLRRDHDRDGVYEHADAIALMDAWWPRWVDAEFRPALGAEAMARLTDLLQVDNPPNNEGDHLGSAYQGSWYGYVSKDLRTTLGRRVRGRYARRYCGSRRHCRGVLRRSLRAALDVPRSQLYGADAVCRQAGKDGDQWCYDAIRQRPIGGVTQPLIHWINRPTYQQADEITARAGR